MALPIGSTPTLYGKEAEEFTKKIEEDLKKPVGLIPTPKLEEARKRIYAMTHEIKFIDDEHLRSLWESE